MPSVGDSALPPASRARSAATTVGSTGSECTVISCDRARRGAAFLCPAKIECVLQAEAAQHGDIGFGQMAEMVGAEDVPPAHRAAVLAGITAEIAKIAGAGEIEMTDGGILHRLS